MDFPAFLGNYAHTHAVDTRLSTFAPAFHHPAYFKKSHREPGDKATLAPTSYCEPALTVCPKLCEKS